MFNIKIRDILQNQIEDLSKAEEEDAQKMLSRYREVRRKLIARLSQSDPERYTAQKLRQTLAQVDDAIRVMSSNLKEDWSEYRTIYAGKSLDDLVGEIELFSDYFKGAEIPINTRAVEKSIEPDNLLLNRFQASIDTYSESVRGGMKEALTESIIMQDSLGEFVSKMKENKFRYSKVVKGVSQFLVAEEWRLLRIARTELHHVYNTAKIDRMKSVRDLYAPDLYKAMIHPMDERTAEDSKQLAAINPVIPIEDNFIFNFKRTTAKGNVVTVRREFAAPPDRPNDRAILIPIRKQWIAK